MAEIVALHQSCKNSTTIAYGHHGCVQVFVGRERDYAELREGFERILSYQKRHNWMLIKLNASADYSAQYVDCGPIVQQQEPGGLFSDDARQLDLVDLLGKR